MDDLLVRGHCKISWHKISLHSVIKIVEKIIYILSVVGQLNQNNATDAFFSLPTKFCFFPKSIKFHRLLTNQLLKINPDRSLLGVASGWFGGPSWGLRNGISGSEFAVMWEKRHRWVAGTSICFLKPSTLPDSTSTNRNPTTDQFQTLQAVGGHGK